MGKKSPNKTWLLKYDVLNVVQVEAKTEGAAKTIAFRFLLKNGLVQPHQRSSFMNTCRVGILRQTLTNTELT